MFEQFGFTTTTPQQAAFWAGLIFGALFGILAQLSAFCLRRALATTAPGRGEAALVWASGFATAMLGTQLLASTGLVDFSPHRFADPSLPLPALIGGGLCFGIGMMLTRGCITRLSILSGTGNLRAFLCVILFAITAQAALKGVLAPLAAALTAPRLTLPAAILPGGWLIPALLWLAIIFFALRSREVPNLRLLMGVMIGALVPLAWLTSGYLLLDEFDPLPLDALSITASAADSLFYLMAATAIAPNFGTGFYIALLVGAIIAALAAGKFSWQGFEGPRQTLRYGLGAVMMGFGSVVAGGCTIGVGLSGTSLMSFAALIALGSIILGGVIGNILSGDSRN